MGEEAFELWDGQFVARKPMQLWELDINTVSIVIFLDFFLKLCTKHYQTLSHTFGLLFSGRF